MGDDLRIPTEMRPPAESCTFDAYLPLFSLPPMIIHRIKSIILMNMNVLIIDPATYMGVVMSTMKTMTAMTMRVVTIMMDTMITVDTRPFFLLLSSFISLVCFSLYFHYPERLFRALFHLF